MKKIATILVVLALLGPAIYAQDRNEVVNAYNEGAKVVKTDINAAIVSFENVIFFSLFFPMQRREISGITTILLFWILFRISGGNCFGKMECGTWSSSGYIVKFLVFLFLFPESKYTPNT